MKKTKIILVTICMLIYGATFAQSKVFDNVVDIELRGSTEIVNNNQIVGYALFYKIDKLKKSAMFKLSILDENLKEIGTNEFEGPKDLLLTKAIYESERIFLSFYDEDKKDGYEKFVKVFDLKGKEKGTVPYEPEKVKKGMFGRAMADQNDRIYEGATNVEGKGLLTSYQSKAKTGGVDVQMIGLDGKLKWESSITASKGDRTDMYLLGATTNTILFFKMEKGGVMSADGEIFLTGLDATTGKERFSKPLEIKGTAYEPMMLKKMNDGKLKIVSSMTDGGAKFYKAKPIGISISDLNDITGELKTVKDFSFQNELGSVMEMKNESKSEDGYIKAHDLCIMQDGSMVIVGEFFRRTVSALGVASKILGNGGQSLAQGTVGDMFLLRIDNNLKPRSLEKIDKDKVRVQLPGETLSIGLLMKWLKYTGAFGYMYTDEGMDGKNKTVLAEGEFGDEKYGTVAITINEKNGYSTKRFNLVKEKKVSYRIFRAKPGYVMVLKYNSKEKSLTSNLEKVN